MLNSLIMHDVLCLSFRVFDHLLIDLFFLFRTTFFAVLIAKVWENFFVYFGFLRRNSNIADIHTMPINDIHMLYDLHLASYRNNMGIQGDPDLYLAEIIR